MKPSILTILMAYSCLACTTSTDTPSINGVWKSIGSGQILHVQDSTQYAFYDITSTACVPTRSAEAKEMIESLSINLDTLSLKLGVMTYRFTRLENLPDLCATELSDIEKNDPLFNFEVFAETVGAHYAFMELNDIDWPKLYQQQRSKIMADPSDVTLYQVIEETLESINDNHAFLEGSDEIYDQLDQLDQLDTEEETEAPDGLKEYGDFGIADMVAKEYLVEDMTEDSWLMKWGKMEDNVGFIQVKAMWLYADLDIPESRIKEMGYVDAYVHTFHLMNEGTYIEKEVAAAGRIMDQVMIDLQDNKAIVIDVRFNGGGQDAVNFEILKRFNPERRKVFTVQWHYNDTKTKPLPVYLEASSSPYTRPVYILTSQQTGSAAEAFAMGSLTLPHVHRIGSHTQGAISTSLERTLPNGWAFAISNEISTDDEGISYENIGVPADYPLFYPEDRQDFFRSIAEDVARDKRRVIEAIADYGNGK